MCRLKIRLLQWNHLVLIYTVTVHRVMFRTLNSFFNKWCFNPFPNKPWFLRVCSTSLLRTLREKEKSLVMSDFSFSHSVFTCLENFLAFSSNLKLLSANPFSLEESEICHLERVNFFTTFNIITVL